MPRRNKLNRVQNKKIIRSSLRSCEDRKPPNKRIQRNSLPSGDSDSNDGKRNKNNKSSECQASTSQEVDSNDLCRRLSLSFPKKQESIEQGPSSSQNPDFSGFFVCKHVPRPNPMNAKQECRHSPIFKPKNSNPICTKIAENISRVVEVPEMQIEGAMDRMIEDMQKWTFKEFLNGLMDYLRNPMRKVELLVLHKVDNAPPSEITPQERALLYVVTWITWGNIDTVKTVLLQIKNNLMESKESELGVIEIMARFYALLCIHSKETKLLRLFVLDALYNLHYSAVAVIRQCFDVWEDILPLAGTKKAREPLTMSLVYLLHFFEFDDNDVKDIRNTMKQKYSFQVKAIAIEKVLRQLQNAILKLKDDEEEKDMLRLTLLIISKRHRKIWYKYNMVATFILPVIWKVDIPEKVVVFCISLLGALFTPYNRALKEQCKSVMNFFIYMLSHYPSPAIEDAIFTSLSLMRRYDQRRFVAALVFRQPTLLVQGKRKSCRA